MEVRFVRLGEPSRALTSFRYGSLLVDSDCQSTMAVRTLYQWVLTATD